MPSISFVDVETTGLTNDDRIVSIGIVRAEDPRAVGAGGEKPRFDHLIFNPGRRSHPMARKVHGYADDYLARQPDFGAHAGEIFAAFDAERLVAAHNVSFDRRFLVKEFERAGYPLSRNEYYCTMLAHRQKYGAPSGLDAVVKQVGYATRGAVHGALQDAWLSFVVYCWLQNLPLPPLSSLPDLAPTNAVDRRPTNAIAPPPLAPIAVPAPASAAVRSELTLIRPMATLMMFIARADGQVARTEIESISLLMHTMLAGRAPMADSEQQDMLAVLCGLEPTVDDLDEACALVLADPAMRKALPGWLRQVGYADGSLSGDEGAALHVIAERIQAVRQRTPFQ